MFKRGSIWGIDLGESGLKAVKMSRQKNRLVIEDCVVTRYADMTTDSDVPREELMQLALRQLAARVGKTGVVAGIPSENVLSRFISLPPVEKRHLKDIVVYEARQQIPFDLNEVVWDYQRVKSEYVVGEEVDIGLFAAKREHIDQYLSALEPVGANLDGLKLSPLAVYEYIRKDFDGEKPLIILDIGAKTTDLIIMEGDKFWLRNLRKAGNSFTQAIQRKFNISFEEAENVKQHMAQSKHRAKIFEVLAPLAQELVTEIQRSVGYYKTLSREAKFEDIVIVGGGYQIHGLDRFMSERLQYNVRTVEKMREIDVAPAAAEAFNPNIASLTSAVGLALQGLGDSVITVQFLPEDYLIRRELGKKKISAVAASLLVALSIGALWVGSAMASANMSGFERVGEPVLQSARSLETRFNQAKGRGDSELQQVRDLMGLNLNRDIWAVRLHGLANALPEFITINSLQVSQTPGTAFAEPGRRDPGMMDTGYDPYDDYDMGPGAMRVGPDGEKWFTFTARADVVRGVEAMRDELYHALANATVFPERVMLFDEVRIGPIRLEETLVDDPAPTIRRDYGMMEDDFPVTQRAAQRMLRAEVACKLVSEDTINQRRREAIKE